jgi:DDE superfamily endonuclease/Tc5 transposase DNA-binding domain
MKGSIGDWPDLEYALFEWQQRMEQKRAIITGDILKTKAKELWAALPQHDNIEEPKWSNSWLEGFKKRYKIKEYVQHGEASSATTDNPDNITQMEALQHLCTKYKLCDILNMDETGLNWKRTPDRTLATKSHSGTKKSKDRITIALTSNADGSEKFLPWVIGKSENPRCFSKINRNNLRIMYRFNKSKWMTGLICEEYLRWLDNKMRGEGRKVLLLMDNFSGHELAVKLVGGLQGLLNIRIAWLPPNTTSAWQPMDQGIIASFKLQYRKLWIEFMLREYEADKNPQKTVNLLKAVQWTRAAWELSVTRDTIKRCWVKSTLIKKSDSTEESAEDSTEDCIVVDDGTDRAELRDQITQLPIENPLSLDEFLNPEDEVIVDEDDDIFTTVVEHYSIDKPGEEDELSDTEEVEQIDETIALRAIETIRLGKLQRGTDQDIKVLDRIEREVVRYKSSIAHQTMILRFFKPN